MGALYGIVVYLEYRDRVLFKQKCEFLGTKWEPGGNIEYVPSGSVGCVQSGVLSMYMWNFLNINTQWIC